MVEIPSTGQLMDKPRQIEENSNSTDPQQTTGLPQILQESPVLQQAVPSSQATSTVDVIPTVPSALQNKNSTPRTPRNPGHPPGVLKEFLLQGLDYQNIDSSCT